jgi:hypothetical protein
VSPRGELPLGAGLNAQWARLVSSHPLMAPSSRPGWPDVPPPPSIFALGSTSLNEALPPFACGGSGAGESVCASPRAAKSKGRPGSMNIMNGAGRGRTPDARVPPGPPRTPPALKSSLSTPSLAPLSHPAHNLVLLFLVQDRDNFPRHSAGIIDLLPARCCPLCAPAGRQGWSPTSLLRRQSKATRRCVKTAKCGCGPR